MSEIDPLPPAEPGTRPGMSTRRIAVLALVAGALAGLAGVYGIGGFDGNAGPAGKCAASASHAAALTPFAIGDVAAFAPASTPRDLSKLAFNGPDGAPTTLEAWRGRTVLLNLWATWCGPCRKEMPALDRLQAAHGSPDFEVVAINLDTRAPEKSHAFLAEIGVKALAFHADPSLALFRNLQQSGLARGLPTTILVDRSGCELGVMAGPAEWDGAGARKLIEAAMKK